MVSSFGSLRIKRIVRENPFKKQSVSTKSCQSFVFYIVTVVVGRHRHRDQPDSPLYALKREERTLFHRTKNVERNTQTEDKEIQMC